MRYAVVDIGSNTVKVNIFTSDMSEVFYRTRTLGLITYTNNNVMSDTGIALLIDTIAEYKQLITENAADEAVYIATASLRNLDNQSKILTAVYNATGVNIEVLSGHDEARYSFEGLRYRHEISTGLMIDMGGGSTEIIGFRDGKLGDVISLPIGCLKLYNAYVSDILPTADEITSINSYVDTVTSDIPWLADYGDTVYLIGGTARALESFGKLTTYDDFPALLLRIGTDRDLINEKTPSRLTTIIPGLTAYCRLLHRMNTRAVVVTQTSIREGWVRGREDTRFSDSYMSL